MRSSLAGVALAAGMLAATSAHASNDPLALTWSAPPGCPSGDDVKAAALRGNAPGATETVVARATVEQTGPTSWRVRLQIRGSERDIEGTTCAGVADATAVVLALALVPTQTIEPEPTPEVTPTPAAPPAPQPPGPAGHRFAAGVAAIGSLGTLPNTAIGGAIDLAWTPGRVRIEVEGSLLAPQSAHVGGKSAGARFGVTTLGGRGCFAVVRTSSFDLAPCAGADAKIASADGFGADQNVAAGTTWASLAAGALGRAFLTRWLAVRLRAEGDAALAPRRFLVEGQGLVFHPPTFGAAAFFGAEVLFL